MKRQRKPRQPKVVDDDKRAAGPAWAPTTSTIQGGSAPSTALVSAAAARAAQLGEIGWKTLNESRAVSSLPQQPQQHGAMVLSSSVPDKVKGKQVQKVDPHFSGKIPACLRHVILMCRSL